MALPRRAGEATSTTRLQQGLPVEVCPIAEQGIQLVGSCQRLLWLSFVSLRGSAEPPRVTSPLPVLRWAVGRRSLGSAVPHLVSGFPSRSAHLVSRYRPRAPIIAVTRNEQTARQAHLYRGIFPVLCKEPAHDSWAEDVDLRVNLGMNVGE